MALNFTSQRIKELITRSKEAEHYSKSELETISKSLLLSNHCDIVYETFKDKLSFEPEVVEIDNNRMCATKAQELLDRYFKQHPEDSIENYLD